MTRQSKNYQESVYTLNPFEVQTNTAALIENLNNIDTKDIRTKFKSTQDPINYAFESFEQISLTALAKDFIKESITDVFEFITNVCK